MIVALDAGAQAPAGASTALPPAREVIKRHVAAIGGEVALARFNSRYVWGTYDRPARRLKGKVEVYAARPGRRLIKIHYPDVGTETTVFDGTNAWTVNAGGTPRLIDRRQLPQLRDESVFDLDLHADSLFRVAETVEETDFEGRRCVKLHLVSTSQREWWEFYDVKTGLFAGSIAQRETDKEPVTLRTVVTEYGTWDGVRLPKTIRLRAAGVEDIIRVIDVKHNAVSDRVFEMPAALRR
jgi:hypothetical protein